MTHHDLPLFIAELAQLSELYNRPLSEGLQALYFEGLSHYPIEQVVSAIRTHMRQADGGRFFPKPADLIALLEGDPESQALLAWTTVVEAWVQHGLYESVVFENPVITQVLADMGGWVDFDARYRLTKEEPFLRKEFCTRYQGALPSAETLRPPRALPGLHEIANQRTGRVSGQKEPIRIPSGQAAPPAIRADFVPASLAP